MNLDFVVYLQRNREREAQTRAQFVTMVRSAIESLLVDDIALKQEAAERSANELLKELQQETDELLRRCSELQQLEHTKDPLHLLQVRDTLRLHPRFFYTKDAS